MKIYNIDEKLQELHKRVKEVADSYNLDSYPMVFQLCDIEAINLLAAREGFPVRYPHWRFGMNYNQLRNQHTFGWGKIYEMVINNDPCYAYLLNTNEYMDQKLVMAHVYGHGDFFKNNDWFSSTNRDMINVMASNASKIKRYMKKYGQDKVENFIDQVLSLENLISQQDMFKISTELNNKQEEEYDYKDQFSSSLQSYLNNNKEDKKDIKEEKDNLNTIQKPIRDILKFLSEEAPLENWQSDVISILRKEAYYFLPQRMTKIMNEGWASYWHSEMMTKHLLDASEVVSYADVNSSVLYMDQKNINPYKIGVELFKYIKEKWDKGQFGIDYLECTDLYEKDNWDTKAMLGTKKIFEVRKIHNDLTFLDEFLTPEFCKNINYLYINKILKQVISISIPVTFLK
jgi:stage V sporulation protein R